MIIGSQRSGNAAKARYGLDSISHAVTEAVTGVQRFGSALNLNVHLHSLFPDGVWEKHGKDLVFRRLGRPTPDEVRAIGWRTCRRPIAQLRREGQWLDADDIDEPTLDEEDFATRPTSRCRRTSWPPVPAATSSMCMRRSASSGEIVRDSSVERLVALIPAPRTHMLRYHGALAPNAAMAARLVLAPVAPSAAGVDEPRCTHSGRQAYATLMQRVFAVDVERCRWWCARDHDPLRHRQGHAPELPPSVAAPTHAAR